jgi:hypothetical protein
MCIVEVRASVFCCGRVAASFSKLKAKRPRRGVAERVAAPRRCALHDVRECIAHIADARSIGVPAMRAHGSLVARTRRVHSPRSELMIRKLKSGQYRLYSRKTDPRSGKRRNLGTFATRKAAEQHERAVQYFKRH